MGMTEIDTWKKLSSDFGLVKVIMSPKDLQKFLLLWFYFCFGNFCSSYSMSYSHGLLKMCCELKFLCIIIIIIIIDILLVTIIDP